MSDRASVQKSFNSLLADYRATTLPSVINNWETLTETEKSCMCEMYHFFCGMHLVVNMAEHTAEALRLFESAEGMVDSSESGTVRLIRTACKAFQRRGCEKSGCPLQFTTYLKSHGIATNPLIHFKGNRFNILFANGGRIYYLRKHIVDFLTKTWGCTNRLLKAVLDDAQNDVYVAGCKALGLIDKLITGPLWRILESNIHVLEVPKYLIALLTFVKSDDIISTFITGEKVPFPGTTIRKDAIWASLVFPSQLDSLVEQILQSCFKCIELLLERVLSDLEPSNVAHASVTSSVPTTNTVSERDFAKLDRLLREKPHASTLALEAHILFTNNKTSAWFASKSQEERKLLMETARKMSAKHKKTFKDRLKALEEKRTQAQLDRERQREETERRVLLQKEKITSDIIHSGLWLSLEDIDRSLEQCSSETQKREALKGQLRFRKTVLQQKYPNDKDIYNFSKKGYGQFNSQKLRSNLIKLIEAARSTSSDSERMEAPGELLFVGRQIDHVFLVEGKLQRYRGKVVSQVPSFGEWYNVVYDEEPGYVYTFKLMDDYRNGDLKVL